MLPQSASPSCHAICRSWLRAHGNPIDAGVLTWHRRSEGQARDRVLAWGATSISSLAKDPDGIWRGTAEWNGKPGQVAVDYKGNAVFKAGF